MEGTGLGIEFTGLNCDHVRGSTDAEVAIGIEAHLLIRDGSTLILSEPRVEVLLLAGELDSWLASRDRSDFVADLGSVHENPGMVRIIETGDGWVVASDLTGRRSTARAFEVVAAVAGDFVSQVRRQVAAAGFEPRRPGRA